MRLEENPQFPRNPETQYLAALNQVLVRLHQSIANKVNSLADGRLSAVDNTKTAAPTAGRWAQGDFVRNSAPVEAGVLMARYVVVGWVCTVSGEPGTFVQCRYLTGN